MSSFSHQAILLFARTFSIALWQRAVAEIKPIHKVCHPPTSLTSRCTRPTKTPRMRRMRIMAIIIITANNNGLVGRSRSSCSDGRRTSRRRATLRAPWGFRPTTGAPWRARCRSTDVCFACSCILSRLWTGVTIRLGPFLSLVPSYSGSTGDPGRNRYIAFESRFEVASPVRDTLSSLFSVRLLRHLSSRSGGGSRRGFTTITRARGWLDTHRRLVHDSFVGDFGAARSAKSGTNEWREARLSTRRARSSISV